MVYNCTTCPRATPRHPFCVSPPGFNPSLRDYKSLAKYAPPCPNLLCCSTVTSTLKSTCRLNCTAALVVVAYSGGYLLLPFELLQELELQELRPEKRQLRANSLCSSCFATWVAGEWKGNLTAFNSCLGTLPIMLVFYC